MHTFTTRFDQIRGAGPTTAAGECWALERGKKAGDATGAALNGMREEADLPLPERPGVGKEGDDEEGEGPGGDTCWLAVRRCRLEIDFSFLAASHPSFLFFPLPSKSASHLPSLISFSLSANLAPAMPIHFPPSKSNLRAAPHMGEQPPTVSLPSRPDS